jgi:uncharacterized membrane protein
VIDALRNLAIDWGSFYANHAAVRTAVTFAHIGGLVASGGAAIVADRNLLSALRRDESERRVLLNDARETHAIVLAGLAIVLASGVLLLGADLDTYLDSTLFWTKMALVVLLMINGAVLWAAERRAAWGTLRWTAIASLALWTLTTLTGTGLLNS